MDDLELKLIVEALLMSSGQPLSFERLLGAFDQAEKPTADQLARALSALENDATPRAFELKHLAGGYCFQTKTRSLEYKHQLVERFTSSALTDAFR